MTHNQQSCSPEFPPSRQFSTKNKQLGDIFIEESRAFGFAEIIHSKIEDEQLNPLKTLPLRSISDAIQVLFWVIWSSGFCHTGISENKVWVKVKIQEEDVRSDVNNVFHLDPSVYGNYKN